MDPSYTQHVDNFHTEQVEESSVPVTVPVKHMQANLALTYEQIPEHCDQQDFRNNTTAPSSYSMHIPATRQRKNIEVVKNFTSESWNMSQQLLKDSSLPVFNSDSHTRGLSTPSFLSSHLHTQSRMFNEMTAKTFSLSNTTILQSVNKQGGLNENVILKQTDNEDIELTTQALTQTCQNLTAIPNSDSIIQLTTVNSPNHFPVLQTDRQQNFTQTPDIRQAVNQLIASDQSPTVTQVVPPTTCISNESLIDSSKDTRNIEKQTGDSDNTDERKSVSKQCEYNVTDTEVKQVMNEPNKDTNCDNLQNKINSFQNIKMNLETKGGTPKKKKTQRNNRLALRMKRVLCNLCKQEHILCDCPLLSPQFYIFNNINCSNSSVMSLRTLPQKLFLGYTNDEHGLGIFAGDDIPKGTQFGPVEGKKVTFEEVANGENLKYIWFVDKDEDTDDLEYMRTEDELSSNWCRYLRASVVLKKCNMICFTKDHKIYFISQRKIKQGKELVFYYIFLEELSHRYGWNFEIISNKDQKNCHRCRIKYNDVLNYAKHIMISHPKGLKMLKSKCKICNKILYSHKDLTNHAISEHGGQGAFVCDRCGKHFVSHHRLAHHNLLVHHVAGIFTCEQCGKSYGSTWKLKDHVRNKHSGMVYTCVVCHKSFTSKPVFIRHKKIHNKNYRFSCDRCGKQCRDGNNLKVHMLTHSGIKPFQCREYYCNAAFTTKQCLQIHYRKAHGYLDENMPVISREVPFTVEAYTRSKINENSEYRESSVMQ